MNQRKNKDKDVEITSYLRKLLIDLEAGKVVRVALDLQILIQELEQNQVQGSGYRSSSSQRSESDYQTQHNSRISGETASD